MKLKKILTKAGIILALTASGIISTSLFNTQTVEAATRQVRVELKGVHLTPGATSYKITLDGQTKTTDSRGVATFSIDDGGRGKPTAMTIQAFIGPILVRSYQYPKSVWINTWDFTLYAW